MAAKETGQKVYHGAGSFFGVGAVEDEKPPRMFAQPAANCSYGIRLRCLPLRQKKQIRAGQRVELAAQSLWRVGTDQEQGRITCAIPPRVLDREPRLADSS